MFILAFSDTPCASPGTFSLIDIDGFHGRHGNSASSYIILEHTPLRFTPFAHIMDCLALSTTLLHMLHLVALPNLLCLIAATCHKLIDSPGICFGRHIKSSVVCCHQDLFEENNFWGMCLQCMMDRVQDCAVDSTVVCFEADCTLVGAEELCVGDWKLLTVIEDSLLWFMRSSIRG